MLVSSLTIILPIMLHTHAIPANAVAHHDNLEFLSDLIPQTTTLKKYREKKANQAAKTRTQISGQTTLEGGRISTGLAETMNAPGENGDSQADVARDTTEEDPDLSSSNGVNGTINGQHHGTDEHDKDGDVAMS
jgi:hypothetical protein